MLAGVTSRRTDSECASRRNDDSCPLELTIQNYGFRSANHESDASSDEKPILILGYLNRTRAIFVIVTHMIDTTAHGLTDGL